MNVKKVKIPSLEKQWSNVNESLKNRTYLEKRFFNFLGADFLALKSSHQHEKQPVLGPGTFSNVLANWSLTFYKQTFWLKEFVSCHRFGWKSSTAKFSFQRNSC